MESAHLVLSQLKGSINNSSPTILSSYPQLEVKGNDFKELVPKFLPFGSNIGDFSITEYSKYNVLSYIFRIENVDARDELVSISVLIKKKDQPERYMPILQHIIESMKTLNVLNENTITKNMQNIFEAMNNEINLELEGNLIKLEDKFMEINEKYRKNKTKVKGSFF